MNPEELVTLMNLKTGEIRQVKRSELSKYKKPENYRSPIDDAVKAVEAGRLDINAVPQSFRTFVAANAKNIPSPTKDPSPLSGEQSQLQSILTSDVAKGEEFWSLYKRYGKKVDEPLIRYLYNQGPTAKQWGPAKETPDDLAGLDTSAEAPSNLELAKLFLPSPEQEKSAYNAEVAMPDVAQIERIALGPNSKKALNLWNYGIVGKVLGGTDTGLYQNSAKNAYDIITRTRTGAALNLDEQKFYKDFVPTMADNDIQKKDKIARLKRIFELAMKEGEQPYDILSGGMGAVKARQERDKTYSDYIKNYVYGSGDGGGASDSFIPD